MAFEYYVRRTVFSLPDSQASDYVCNHQDASNLT